MTNKNNTIILQQRNAKNNREKKPHHIFQVTMPTAAMKQLNWKKGSVLKYRTYYKTYKVHKETGIMFTLTK